MRVIVLQVGDMDTLTEEQIAKLQAATEHAFVDAVNKIGIKTTASNVNVSILEGPDQRTRAKPKKEPESPSDKS